jgi:hypothetical protein
LKKTPVGGALGSKPKAKPRFTKLPLLKQRFLIQTTINYQPNSCLTAPGKASRPKKVDLNGIV